MPAAARVPLLGWKTNINYLTITHRFGTTKMQDSMHANVFSLRNLTRVSLRMTMATVSAALVEVRITYKLIDFSPKTAKAR